MDDPLALFPTEVIYELLYQAEDLATIVYLYKSNPKARSVLDCQSLTPSPRIDRFVGDADCVISKTQQDLFDHINTKFNLKLTVVTWSKILRAYNLSGANPTCDDYSSIYDCLKSAVKLGLSTAVDTLYLAWEQRQRDYSSRNGGSSGLDKYSFLPLVTAAYKHNHLDIGDRFYSKVSTIRQDLDQPGVAKMIYFRLKAWVREILMPFKVKKTRDIRQAHYLILYDPSIDNKIKVKIWASKYDFNGKSPAQEMAHRSRGLNAPPEIVRFAMAKVGIYHESPVTAWDQILYLFLLYSRGPLLIKKLGEKPGVKLHPMTIPIAIKLGYFDAKTRGYRLVGWVKDIGKQRVRLVKFLTKFTLSQLQALCEGLNKHNPNRLCDDEGVLLAIVFGGMSNLYFQYKNEHNINYGKIAANMFDDANVGLRSLGIVNDLLASIIPSLNPRNTGHTRIILEHWLGKSLRLLVKIWQRYGRRQLEDSLIYLHVHFGVRFQLSTLNWSIGGVFSSEGFLAYLFGLRLDKNRQLSPLTEPGIVELGRQFLLEKRSFLLGGLRYRATYNQTDVAQTFLDILKYYDVEYVNDLSA